MTSTELKETLNSIADTLDQGAKVFPFKLNEEVIKLISNLDDTSIKLLATLLSMQAENVKSLIPNVVNLLETGDKLFGTDQHVKISNFCRALSNRPVILGMISRFI
jgi:hypothetical protein